MVLFIGIISDGWLNQWIDAQQEILVMMMMLSLLLWQTVD